ncbi:MAG: dienelactone hydrolase family protein [Bacteroidales bacterium]|nr:dienelactone hydrolase family protein [Bacteroidales bacterium]
MNDQIQNLFNDYRRGGINRRDFLRKLTLYAGGAAAATALLPLLTENQVMAAGVTPDENDVVTAFVTYPGKTGEMKAFMAHPAKKKKLPAVIIIHEIWGLNKHIQDVTRRMAAEGFLAIAPDALSAEGGTPENDTNKTVAMVRALNMEETTANFVAAVKYLETHPLANGKVGCTGFCWGGAMTNRVAVNAPELDAAVPYYGSQPDAADVAKIKAPVLAHYAGDDERINAGIPAFEEALKKAGLEYQIFMYEGAKHAFNNDSNPERYHEAAAKLAWGRTVAFFREKLM